MATFRASIAPLGLSCLALLLLVVATAYLWSVLGGEGFYDALIATLKLLLGFAALLAIAASINAVCRRCLGAQSGRQGE